MGENIIEYEVQTKPFEIGSRGGIAGFHDFTKRHYHSDIVYVKHDTYAKKFKAVFHMAASQITENPKEFDLEKLTWCELKERFNDLPVRIVGRIKLPASKENESKKLEEILHNVIAESIRGYASIKLVKIL